MAIAEEGGLKPPWLDQSHKAEEDHLKTFEKVAALLLYIAQSDNKSLKMLADHCFGCRNKLLFSYFLQKKGTL